MPDGKTHDKITLRFSPVLIIGLFLLNIPFSISIIITIGYFFSAYMFNGDLDLYSRPYRRWGFLRFIWKPYQNTFSHRSFFTHGLIVGTLIRLIYLFGIPFIIMMFMGINAGIIFFNPISLMFYIGLEIGAMSHTVADKIYSFLK